MELEQLRGAFFSALRASDEQAAHRIITQATAAGMDPATIYLQIFTPSMIAIGELWERNELNIVDEHLATAITERLIGMLSPQFSAASAGQVPGIVVLGCTEGERHVLGPRMLADLFRRRGWMVLYLGADVPAREWVALVQRYQAHVAAISLAMRQHVPQARQLIEQLRAARPSIQIMVGGQVFMHDPSLGAQIGADICNADPIAAIEHATQYVYDLAAPREQP